MNTPVEKFRELLCELQALSDMLPDTAPAPGASAQIVVESKACELTGYTPGQLRGRRRDGTHKQGVIWWHDGKGSIVYDMQALTDWMRNGDSWHQARQVTPACNDAATPSASTSTGEAVESLNPTPPRRRLRA